ncbi:nucleotidyltransferase family protein [Enterobacterales bacterium AW_CKDN230030176-1A_HGKHYDSX7]
MLSSLIKIVVAEGVVPSLTSRLSSEKTGTKMLNRRGRRRAPAKMFTQPERPWLKEKAIRPTDAIRGKERAIRRLIEGYGFIEPKLFGSAARGDDLEGSDLDLLATIPPAMAGRISLFDIADLEDELQALVGVPVDFHVHNNIPEHLRPSIELEMVTL